MSKKELALQEQTEVVVNDALVGMTYKDAGVLELIQNKQLKNDVKKLLDAENKTFKGQWEMVEAVTRMTTRDGELDSDFGTLQELADFLNTSVASISKMKNLGLLPSFLLKERGFTVGNAYEFLPLKSEEEIALVINDNELDDKSSQKDIRQAVKARKQMLKAREQVLLTETESEPEVEEVYKGDILSNYSDDAKEELCVEYTLPVWTVKDGGYVMDMTLSFTESVSEELAKVISAFLEQKSHDLINK